MERRLQISLPASTEPTLADGDEQATSSGIAIPDSASNMKEQASSSIQTFAVQDQQIQNALDLVDCEGLPDLEKS
jgi:hypothetical protein